MAYPTVTLHEATERFERKRAGSPHATCNRSRISTWRSCSTASRPQHADTTAVTDDQEREAAEVLAAMRREEKHLPPYYRDTVLPEGCAVIVALRDVQVSSIQGASEKWFSLFAIVDCLGLDAETTAAARGRTILRSYNAPRRGWLSRSHALYGDYVAVVGRPLRTVPRVSPRAFLRSFLVGCHVEAVTRRVVRRMDAKARCWVPTPVEDHYSVIDYFIKRVDGCPPVLQVGKKWQSEPECQPKREPQ
jgi:hypothetical protein